MTYTITAVRLSGEEIAFSDDSLEGLMANIYKCQRLTVIERSVLADVAEAKYKPEVRSLFSWTENVKDDTEHVTLIGVDEK